MVRRLFPILCTAALLTLAVVQPSCGERAVRVFVGQKPVDEKSIDSAVLYSQGFVPVKETAEALGATVKYDQQTRTLTITGGLHSAVMQIGSRSAVINGTPVYFTYPPYLYDNQAYAPVLLFNQEFNMALMYDSMLRMFRWFPVVPPTYGAGVVPPDIVYGPGLPSRGPAAPVSRTIVGEAVCVYPAVSNPSITVRCDGKTYVCGVTPDAVILRGKIGGKAYEVPLGNIRPGDRVTLTCDSQNRTKLVRARYRFATGKVQSVADGTILLDTGETLQTTAGTEVILPGNCTGVVEDIKPGDTVGASVSPITGKAYVIKLGTQQAGSKSASDPPEQISMSTTGPLRVGDTLVVFFKAQPGGVAHMSIPGIQSDIPMWEIKPGTYRGQYVIQTGDMAIRQPISVVFTAPTGETFTTSSRRSLTIQTIAGYLPRITIPHQGEEIQSPLVVSGIGRPGSTVRVTVGYRADALFMLPMEAATSIEDVVTGEDGHWTTSSLSAVAPFDEDQREMPYDFDVFTNEWTIVREPTIIWTITATELGPNGELKSTYKVETTKKPARLLGGLSPVLVESIRRSSG